MPNNIGKMLQKKMPVSGAGYHYVGMRVSGQEKAPRFLASHDSYKVKFQLSRNDLVTLNSGIEIIG